MNIIGKNIKKLRDSRGLTQQQLADVVGAKSYTTITKWESGANTPQGKDLIVLSRLFNTSVDSILGIDGKVNTETYSDYYYLPTTISAGLPIEVDGITESEKITIPDAVMGKWSGYDDVFIVKANGQSMNKSIPDQSLMAVKPIALENLKDGDIVVYSDNHDYSVKRYYDDVENKRIIFRPHSTDKIFIDDIFYYDNLDGLKIHGKVVVYIVELD